MNSLRETNRDLAQEVQSHKREYEQLQTVSIWYSSNRDLAQEVQSHKRESMNNYKQWVSSILVTET